MIRKHMSEVSCDVVANGVSGVVTCAVVPFAIYIDGRYNGTYNDNSIDVVLPSDRLTTISCFYVSDMTKIPETVDEIDDGNSISYMLSLSQYVPAYSVYIDGSFAFAVSKDGMIDLWIDGCVHVYGPISDVVTYSYALDTNTQSITISDTTYTSTNRSYTAPTGLVFEVVELPTADIDDVMLYDSADAYGETASLPYGEHTIDVKDSYYGTTLASSSVFIPMDNCVVTTIVSDEYTELAHTITISPSLTNEFFDHYSVYTNYDTNMKSLCQCCNSSLIATCLRNDSCSFDVPLDLSGTLIYKIQPIRNDGYTNSANYANTFDIKPAIRDGLGNVYITNISVSPLFVLSVIGIYEPKSEGDTGASVTCSLYDDEILVTSLSKSLQEFKSERAFYFSIPNLYNVSVTKTLHAILTVENSDSTSVSNSLPQQVTFTTPSQPTAVSISTRRI